MADIQNWIDAQKENGALGNASGSGNKAKPLLSFNRTNSTLPMAKLCQLLVASRAEIALFGLYRLIPLIDDVELYQTGISHNYRTAYERVATASEKLDAMAKVRMGLGKLMGGSGSGGA